MFLRFSQTVIRFLSALGSRPAVLTAGLLWLCHPGLANAQNLILRGGNQLIGAQGGPNEFGNLSGELFTFNRDDFQGFPSAVSASPSAVAASASLDVLYTQVGDVTTFTQIISQSQDGVEFGMAEHRFTIEFTAIENLQFTFTSNYNGLGTAGSPRYSVFLFDEDTLGNVFFDNSLDPNDLIPVENHSGMLIAGHRYSLSGQSRVAAGDPASGVPTSATGTFVFTTSPVETDRALTSVLIAGPDRNSDNLIDDSIPVRSNSPSEFSFTVTFDGAGAVGATITDTIPKEWELVSATVDDPNDVVTIGGTGAVQITHFDQFALLPSDLLTFWSTGSLPNFRFARPTTYEWQPTDDAGILTVTVRTRPAVRRGRFQPLLRGTYPLNVGAAAFATDGNPLLDNLGEPLIGPPLTLQAR